MDTGAHAGEAAANALNERGVAAYNRSDWKTAIALFEEALQHWSENKTFRKNLANAKRQQQLAEQQNARILDDTRKQTDRFARSLAAATPGSLDFDGNHQAAAGKADGGLNFTKTSAAKSSSDSQSSSDLAFGDPMVVDARHVPTGLPKSVEESIPHTPAGDCTRKGFEAILTHDWKVALAWFQTALYKEPGNPELQRLVDLAQFTLKTRTKAHNLAFEDNSTPVISAPASNRSSASSDAQSAPAMRRPPISRNPLLDAINAFPAFATLAQSDNIQQSSNPAGWQKFDEWVRENVRQ